MRILQYALIAAGFMAGVLQAAEMPIVSTSKWLPIADSDDTMGEGEQQYGTQSKTYLSIRLYTGVLRSQDGWWTKFIKTNEHVGLVATITIPGLKEEVAFSRLQKVTSQQDFQFSVDTSILREQRLGRNDIGVTLSLIATADDGAAEMLNELKAALPTFGIAASDQAIAGVTLAKKLMDAFFKKELLKQSLRAEYDVGPRLKAGVYAILASKESSAYTSIDPSNLVWRNKVLSVKKDGALVGVPNNVSFMVLKVSHLEHLYPDAQAVLRADTKWAAMYRAMRDRIRPIRLGIPNKQDVEKAMKQLMDLSDDLTKSAIKAAALVEDDASLTQDEKYYIGSDMMPDFLQDAIRDEYAALEAELKKFSKIAADAQKNTSASKSGKATVTIDGKTKQVDSKQLERRTYEALQALEKGKAQFEARFERPGGHMGIRM